MTEAGFLDLALAHLRARDTACLLDSAGPIGVRSRRSILSGSPVGMVLETPTSILWRDGGGETILDRTTWNAWLSAFAERGRGDAWLFPLITYEAFNPVGPARRPHPIWPELTAAWLVCRDALVYDRETGLLTRPEVLEPGPESGSDAVAPGAVGWRETEAAYSAEIEAVQRDIRDGIYYQANLSQRFVCRSERDPFAVYRDLRARNPSPFMGIFELGGSLVLSGSPERLVAKRGDALRARPIAGTRPRFDDPGRDAESRAELLASEKERAEHLMLVDLIRNDLGRVAATGSVRVEEFLAVESYSHVHHLVSEVVARIGEGVGPAELIASMFPGGTITGAPKISCMDRLRVLEGERRGPYTGAIGYLRGGGDLDLNILIRTLISGQGHFCLHAGGGIVADSRDAAEILETRYKAAALLEALGF